MAVSWLPGYPNDILCKEIHGTRNEAHNSLSGNPVFSVRVAVEAANVQTAIRRFLGGPAVWPYTTVFNEGLLGAYQKVVCVSCNLVNDAGAYLNNATGELISYTNPQFLDLTYAARPGVYVTDFTGQDVYWEDVVSPRYETQPFDHDKLMWGEKDELNTIPIGDDARKLSPDETPVMPIPGSTLIHTIEGWVFSITDYTTWIGTTNKDSYTSLITGYTFPATTLLLRSVEVTHAYSFRSYREATGIPLKDSHIGRPTQTLKMIYEYKPNKYQSIGPNNQILEYDVNWNKFFRIDSRTDVNEVGYYYIRFNDGNKNKVLPFPPNDHRAFLGLSS